MFPSDQWVVTNFGPVQIKSLLDRPHNVITHNGAEETDLSGYSLRTVDTFVTIEAQGHRLKVGKDHPVYVDDRLALPASRIQAGNELQVYPSNLREWKGAGGTFHEGQILGELIAKFGHHTDTGSEDAFIYLANELGVNLLYHKWENLLTYWFNIEKIETLSSDFYQGYLRKVVLDQVEFDSVFHVDNGEERFDIFQTIRMLMRLGIFAYTTDHEGHDDRLVIPSYSLRQLILAVGFGEQGAELLPKVESVTAPQKYTVQVDRVKETPFPTQLYGTRGIYAGTVTEINNILVATDGK